MSESNEITSDGGGGAASLDSAEVATEYARKRAARETSAVNLSAEWQVRIEWKAPKSTVWPQFTYDTRPTRPDAESCAHKALDWIVDKSGPSVVGACVRAPGASMWEPIALGQLASACVTDARS